MPIGIWYSPYMKIYSLGAETRIMELSTYPRTYLDTARHVYLVDTPFTVTSNDFNSKDGFWDSKGQVFTIGQTATHFAGESLPGAFPKWVESESLIATFDKKLHKFPLEIEAILGQLVDVTILEAEIQSGEEWIPLPVDTVNKFLGQLNTGSVSFAKANKDADKQVIRVKYNRCIRKK